MEKNIHLVKIFLVLYSYMKNILHYKNKINILEIGVDNGDSLRIWREFFSKANICGIDIDEKKNLK